jgi:hypothetical protein
MMYEPGFGRELSKEGNDDYVGAVQKWERTIKLWQRAEQGNDDYVGAVQKLESAIKALAA